MIIKDYLKDKQQIVYRTFSNALKKNVVSHSYLLLGEEGIPLKKIALYLAKSLLCDNPSPLADETCNTCMRIENGSYPDLTILDGSESSIKKDDVTNMVSDFQKTPLEAKGIMVYIINLVENMTVDAINSLLKFLEEPTPGTYAILTSQNESKILPTILSRCQIMRLKLLPRYEVIQEALDEDVALEDAEILVSFYNAGALIKEASQDKKYLNAKEAVLSFLQALNESDAKARFVMEKDVYSLCQDKQTLKSFFDILTLFFQNIQSKVAGDETTLSMYDRIISDLAIKLKRSDASLREIMTLRSDIDSNINPSLILCHLMNRLSEE